MVQKPTVIGATVLPPTTQTSGVSDRKLTVRPDDARAVIPNGLLPNGTLDIGSNVMVWLPGVILMENACSAGAPMLLLAENVPLKIPPAAGIPLMRPLIPSRVSPGGS